MAYVIPITEGASEDGGRIVAEVVFNNGGTPKVVGKTDDASFVERVRFVMKDTEGLGKARFMGPEGTVRGYEGFWGTALALRLALTTVGLSVDWARLEGPVLRDQRPEFDPPPPYDPDEADGPIMLLQESD